MFRCELVSGMYCSQILIQGKKRGRREKDQKGQGGGNGREKSLYLPRHLNASLEVLGMALSITGF